MLKTAFIVLLIAASTIAAQETTVPDTLALSDADALTCRVHGCRTITDAAYEYTAQLIQRAEMRADRAEEMANRLAAELAKKPNPKFCL